MIDATNRDPYDAKYDHGSSKANRLRGFWAVEPNRVVGKLMSEMLEYSRTIVGDNENPTLRAQCERTVARLLQENPVQELDALVAIGNERDFEVVAKAVRDASGGAERPTVVARQDLAKDPRRRATSEGRAIVFFMTRSARAFPSAEGPFASNRRRSVSFGKTLAWYSSNDRIVPSSPDPRLHLSAISVTSSD